LAHAQDGIRLTIHNELGGENQRWAVTQSVESQSAILGVDGYCLDVRGASRQAGAPVQLYQCHFGSNQKFVA
jgi:hypothetical protein